MTERLMMVLAVSACDHVISVTGPAVASVCQGSRRNEQSPNACSGGQCEVALALTDRTLGFVREICPCRRSPVGLVVALVSICNQRT